MTKRWLAMTTLVVLLACVQNAFALGPLRYVITPETQVQQGLTFTLTATPEREGTLLVHMEIPKKGKLLNLGGLQLELRDRDNTLLLTPLATTTKNDTVTVSFRLTPDYVAGCYINLCVAEPDDLRFMIIYAVSMKGYFPDK